LSDRARPLRLRSKLAGTFAVVSDSPDAPAVVPYDEFGLFDENIAEFNLDVSVMPTVERRTVALDDGRELSLLAWGDQPGEIVFVHGGAQNAHTWDTVALALGRPAIAVDLPGHGHSSWRDDGAYSPSNLADDVARAVDAHAPDARVVVGMSLGGLTSMMLATRHPHLVHQLVMVDITPGVNGEKAKAIIDFVNGPQSFTSFDDLLARTIEFNPTRSESSLRRGILHNAHQLLDGSWQWNYDRTNRHGDQREERTGSMPETDVVPAAGGRNPLWDDFAALDCPLELVRGSLSPVVDDDDVAEARRLQPNIVVHMVDGAGHSVQGDRPVELAALLAELFE
jgi:pimeloyl-ACP methyl ester carboxylesterase